MTVVEIAPDTALVASAKEQVAEAVHGSAELVINSQETYSAAGEWLRKLTAVRKDVENRFAPMVKQLHDAHKSALAMRDEVVAPVKDAEQRLRKSMATYADLIEQERRRRVEEEARQRRADEERRLAEAIALEQSGASESKVEAVLATPGVEPLPVIEKPQAAGISARKTVAWEIEDLGALIRAVGNSTAPLEFLEINSAAISAAVRIGGLATKIPGVRVFEKTTMAVR